MRKLIGFGKPRGLQGLFLSILGPVLAVWKIVREMLRHQAAKIAFPSRMAALSPAA